MSADEAGRQAFVKATGGTVPLVLERSPWLEAAIMQSRVPSTLVVASNELVKFAHTRALPGPVRLDDDRDLVQELREEVGDAANYAAWSVLAGQLEQSKAERVGRCLAEIWHILET